MSTVNEWPMVKLGEVVEINPKLPTQPTDEEAITFVPMAAVEENGFISSKALRPYEEVKRGYTPFLKDDLLVAKITPCFQNKKIAMADIDTTIGIGSTEFHVLRTAENINARYLLHFLRQDFIVREGEKCMTGSGGQRRVPKWFLENISVPLPPLAEQQRIADTLDTAAEIIHKGEYLQHSVLPLTINVVERKVASSESTLGNLIESMSSGKNVAESPDPNQKNRVLKVSAVTSGTFRPEESKPLPDTYLPPKAHQVRNGDILVSRANTTQLLGASALVESDVDNLYLPDKIWRVTPQDGVYPYLLWGILQTKTVRARISQRATGSSGSMKNISQKNFLQVPCATFSESESSKLAALIREAVKIHHQLAQKLTLLRSLHHSLSTRAFVGQL